jgi:hypothetical protein
MWRSENDMLAQVRTEARRRRHQHRVLGGLGAIGTLVAVVVLSVILSVGGAGTTTLNVAGGGHAIPSSLVLQAVSGGGDHTGRYFTVPARAKGWTISWSYGCGGPMSDAPGTGNFYIVVQNGPSGGAVQAGISEIGSARSGVKRYHAVGEFRVKVISECTWRYTVTAGS